MPQHEPTGRSALLPVLLLLAAPLVAQDPLPSWNDGAAKRAIVAGVERTTEEGCHREPLDGGRHEGRLEDDLPAGEVSGSRRRNEGTKEEPWKDSSTVG